MALYRNNCVNIYSNDFNSKKCGIVCKLKGLGTAIFELPSSVTIGGTGMLIVVGVAIETYKQMESSLISRSYAAKRKRLR